MATRIAIFSDLETSSAIARERLLAKQHQTFTGAWAKSPGVGALFKIGLYFSLALSDLCVAPYQPLLLLETGALFEVGHFSKEGSNRASTVCAEVKAEEGEGSECWDPLFLPTD